MTKVNDKRAEELFAPILFMFLGAFITIFYFAVHGDNLVSSDSAADMILARVLVRDGGLLSKNWFYSTEILTLDTQLIFKPAYMLFPNDWHTARLLAHTVLTIIYLASMIWMVKASKTGPKGLWAVAVSSFPIGYGYVITMSWSLCYTFYFALAFASLALLFILFRKPDHKIILIILSVVVSFLAGMRTIRALMHFNIPLFGAAVIMILCRIFKDTFKIDQSKIRDTDKPLLKYSLIMLVSALAGYAFNSFYLSNNYHFFSQNDESYWQPFSLNQILKVTGDMIASYGWHEKCKILSLEGLSSCTSIILGIAACASVVLLLFKYSKLLTDNEYIIVLYTFISIVISIFIFAHCDIYAVWHWASFNPFGYFCLAIALKYIRLNYPALQKMRYGIICGLFVFFVSLSWLVGPYFGPGKMDNDTLIPVIAWLDENGYDKGIATFWNSNVTTELSDGHIEMWTIRRFDKMNVYEWLQETSHAQLPEGNVFVLMTKKEFECMGHGIDGYIVYQTADYTVLGFDSVDNYPEIIINSYEG